MFSCINKLIPSQLRPTATNCYIWLCVLPIINLLQVSYIKWGSIKSYVDVFQTMRGITFDGNELMESWEAMLEVKPLVGKSYRLACGGQHYSNIPRNMLRSVISVKQCVDRLKGMNLFYISLENLKHLRNEQLNLQDRLIHLHATHMLGTSSPQWII